MKDLQQLAAPASANLLSVTDMQISESTDERGLVAACEIEAGLPVLEMGPTFQLSETDCTPSLATAVDALAEDLDNFLCKMVCVLHACKLAADTGEDGPRAAYYRTLPQDMRHMPLHYSPDRLATFGPAFPLEKLTGAVRKQCVDMTAALKLAYAQGGNGVAPPSLEFVQWATCCMNSRCFELRSSDAPAEAATAAATVAAPARRSLVMFADLMNHSFNPCLDHSVDPATGIVSFRAARKIAAGEELTLAYRMDDDACSFLLHYGFVPQKLAATEGDESEAALVDESLRVYFRVTLPSSELGGGGEEGAATPLHQAIASLGLSPSPDMALPATVAQPLPGLWIWLLRLKGMTDDQRSGFAKGEVQLTADVEAAAWAELRAALAESQDWYAKAVADGGEKVGTAAGAAAGSSPPMDAFVKRVHATALEVTMRAMAACLEAS
jgi:hypothetical protein